MAVKQLLGTPHRTSALGREQTVAEGCNRPIADGRSMVLKWLWLEDFDHSTIRRAFGNDYYASQLIINSKTTFERGVQ